MKKKRFLSNKLTAKNNVKLRASFGERMCSISCCFVQLEMII